jgi:hypothetical protein
LRVDARTQQGMFGFALQRCPYSRACGGNRGDTPIMYQLPLSIFQHSTISNRRRCASVMRRFRAGRDSLEPDTPSPRAQDGFSNRSPAVVAAKEYLQSPDFKSQYEGRVAGAERIKALSSLPEFNCDSAGWKGFYSVLELGHLIPLYRDRVFRIPAC